MSEDITKTCRDISKLKPVAQVACNLFLAECKKQGLDIFITETYRSQARQTYLYEQGRTRPGNIVTNVKVVGMHGKGLAWDIACGGKILYDDAIIAKCGKIAESLGIEWGGSWVGFKDSPHMQVSENWKAPMVIADDLELSKAVSKIITSGIQINFNNWKRIDLIKLSNVPALLNKLGGNDSLVANGVISNKELWVSGKYTEKDVRSLLIKYANIVCK